MGSHSPNPSTLIIGAGIFGTSTAYHLAKTHPNPSQITIVDRTCTPPSCAASTDINKIIRADYSSRFYCDLAYEALEAWKSWPELNPSYHQSGWVMGHDPTADIALGELEGRWKGCLKGTSLEGMRSAYWNPEAGWCEASAATASLMQAALEMGVKYVQADVKGFELREDGVGSEQTTDGSSISADKIVLATGAWTSSLLSPLEDELRLSADERIEKQAETAGVAVAHFKMSETEMGNLSDMPVVVYGEHGEVIPPPASNRLLKFTNANTFTNIVTTKSGYEISVPPDRDQHDVPEWLKRETEREMMAKVMPLFAADRTAEYWRICYDARTPTQDWLLCQHPNGRLKNLFFAVGGSFHSYKFLPNAGKYMVNVLSGEGNGEERDRAWGWKDTGVTRRGAHEKTAPKRDLKDVEN